MSIRKPRAVTSALRSPSRVRLSYVTLCAICRQLSATAYTASSGQFNRSDFGNQPFTGIYEAGQPTQGPLGGASIVGSPRITPRMLKDHLDQFVVGQERAKKVLSTAVYNHYQRIQELQRQDEEFEELMAQQARRDMGHHGQRHPMEDEFPGQQPTVHLWPPGSQPPVSPPQPSPIQDYSPLTIEKSNILLLGPSGVGKTLMAKTLARVLEVPFSMSDCTPLTQAGYIGEDAEVVVQRLLAAANYDVARAEHGIICLDEIDKIATAKVSHGKDVSGEGVQQALLKIIEGTTLQIQAKQERGSASSGRQGNLNIPQGPNYTPLGSNVGPPPGSGGQGGKSEVYNIRTDNILFICTGAFIGLHKVILDRISKGSIGFGANVRASAHDQQNPHNTTLRASEHGDLFKHHIPFFTPSGPDQQAQTFNTLDLVEPADLQKYGMIPELVGRIPISCALSSLDEEALVRVLTEPRNALLKQYEQLFHLSGIELGFTSPALRAIAADAAKMGTGARGLKTVLERLLGEAMFETPGSQTKYIVVTEDVARRKRAPVYLHRGHSHEFHSLIADEEMEWRRRVEKDGGEHGGDAHDFHDFREYREKASAAGL